MSTPTQARRLGNHAEIGTPPAFPGTYWGGTDRRDLPCGGMVHLDDRPQQETRRIKGKMRIQEFPAATSPFAVGTDGRVSTSWRTDGSRYTHIQCPSRLMYTSAAVTMIPFVPW